VGPTPEELAEHTEAYMLARPSFETIWRPDLLYIAGPRTANVHPRPHLDAVAAVAWTREESRRREHREIEWWVGWSVNASELGDRLCDQGLVRNADPSSLTGMTCDAAPPAAPEIVVRPVESAEDYLAAVAVDWEVWELSDKERAERRELEIERFDEIKASRVVHHFSAILEGRRVGFARAIDMVGGVALWGGAVLPAARRRGVYRALVRARWEHAVARGTPLLVVQAGPMSTPVLHGLGFESHGEIQLHVDRL
jgi:ribosomal protein S18 acetylase RimI-like enzyme